ELPIAIRMTAEKDNEILDRVAADFRQEYALRYGAVSALVETPIEVVTLRAIGIAAHPPTDVRSIAGPMTPPIAQTARATSSREICLEADAPAVVVDVHRRDALGPGASVAGPACIDAADTTIWVPTGCRATVTPSDLLLIDVPSGGVEQ